MIAYNPILSAWFKVLLFWYLIALSVWIFASDLPFVAMWSGAILALRQTGVVLVAGVAAGVLAAVFADVGLRTSKEQSLRDGSHDLGAQISIGSFPGNEQFAALSARNRHAALAVVQSQAWWAKFAAASPTHAQALLAACALMLRLPELPASPYPGGHGGKTLIEHSLSVVAMMLKEAGRWRYDGQKNKKGDVVVPLLSDEPHRFGLPDAPLLILAAFAHDIGKLATYEATGGPDPASGTVPVRDSGKPHDTEGAKVLRRIPEIMSLPVKDRNALILAVGHYHHPFALPLSGWVTDRMRSLTELLIHADVLTGKSEGHSLLPEDQMADGAMDADADLQPAAAVDAVGLSAAAIGAPVDIAVGPPADAPSSFRILWHALHQSGAISGSYRSTRIAARKGEWLYVYDATLRASAMRFAEMANVAPAWIEEAATQNGGNAARFTVELAEYLSRNGWLRRTHDGLEYAVSRSLFFLAERKEPGAKKDDEDTGKPVPVMIVSMRAFTSASMNAPEDKRDLVILRPLWGSHQGRPPASADTPPRSPDTTSDDSSTDVTTDEAPAGETHSAEAHDAEHGTAPDNAQTQDGGGDAASLGIDQQAIDADAVNQLRAEVVMNVIPYLRIERGTKAYAAIAADSSDGKSLAGVIRDLRSKGASSSVPLIARVPEHDNALCILIDLPVDAAADGAVEA